MADKLGKNQPTIAEGEKYASEARGKINTAMAKGKKRSFSGIKEEASPKQKMGYEADF